MPYQRTEMTNSKLITRHHYTPVQFRQMTKQEKNLVGFSLFCLVSTAIVYTELSLFKYMNTQLGDIAGCFAVISTTTLVWKPWNKVTAKIKSSYFS